MSQKGKFLNLHPHMKSWAVYNVDGPYTTAYKIGDLAPAQYGGLSYQILEEKGGDVYIIQTDSFGRCAIWAPRDNDSSISTSPEYTNGGTSSSGSSTSSGTGKYLNLKPHMQSWAIYNVDGPYTTAYKIGDLAPAQYGGLSYQILEEKGGDVYIIQTDSFGRCAIWAPIDNDSSISTTPEFTNGGVSSSGSSEITSGNGGVELPGGLKVFIDPGHGGNDPGALGSTFKEKDIVLAISKKLGVILNSYGVSVKYSRENDTAIGLEERAQMANNWGASLFVSIHANSATSPASGTECFTKPSANSSTKQLSANVAKSISSKLGIPNRGHKEEVWRVLTSSNMPAILVETAFINHAGDANLLENRQDDFANAIATEILNYFNISNSNMKDLLKYAGSVGLFEGYDIEFERINMKIPIGIISLNPIVTMEGEISLTEKFTGPYKYINLSVGADELTTNIVNDLIEAGITIGFERENLRLSIEKLTLATDISENLKYSIDFEIDGSTVITLESSFEYEENKTVYQRLIIKVKPSYPELNTATVTAPLKATNKIEVNDTFTTIMGVVAIATILGGLYLITGPASIPASLTLLGRYIGSSPA